MEESLWNFGETINIILPKSILKQQENFFNSKMQQHSLFCEVKESFDMNFNPWLPESAIEENDKTMVLTLEINAPSLNNYAIEILKVKYKISSIYPCELCNILDSNTLQCSNSEQLILGVKSILSSAEVGKLIGILLAQVKSESVNPLVVL